MFEVWGPRNVISRHVEFLLKDRFQRNCECEVERWSFPDSWSDLRWKAPEIQFTEIRNGLREIHCKWSTGHFQIPDRIQSLLLPTCLQISLHKTGDNCDLSAPHIVIYPLGITLHIVIEYTYLKYIFAYSWRETKWFRDLCIAAPHLTL